MSSNEFETAKKVLENHGVIAFPTETVMGLGVYFDDYRAYQYLNEIKHRPNDKRYTLMLGDVNDIEKYAFVTKQDKKIIEAFMPGPITVLLLAKTIIPNYVTFGTGVIGIRIPSINEVCEFIKYLNRPLLVPSANRSGEKPAMNSAEVRDIFKEEVGYVFEGMCEGGVPSTVVDLTGEEVKIIREGPIKMKDLKKVLEEKV